MNETNYHIIRNIMIKAEESVLRANSALQWVSCYIQPLLKNVIPTIDIMMVSEKTLWNKPLFFISTQGRRNDTGSWGGGHLVTEEAQLRFGSTDGERLETFSRVPLTRTFKGPNKSSR